MFFEGQKCIHCYSDDVFRLPQGVSSKGKTHNMPSKPGKIVDKYIKEVKQEIKKEKEKLRSEEL